MTKNFKIAPVLLMLGLTVIIPFEQVKASLGLQRVTGEVWMPASASPIALLLCVERLMAEKASSKCLSVVR